MADDSAQAAVWDRAYLSTPPWDIGRPQRAIAVLADELTGVVVEFGCGTGENTLLAAQHGAVAIGLDISPRAVRTARDKAVHRGLDARFEVADVLDAAGLPSALVGVADVLVDSGTFHMFDARDRERYAASARRVLRPGGRCHLLCARRDRSRHWGPPGLTADDAAVAFGGGWRVAGGVDTVFEVTAPLPAIPATLITLERMRVA